MWGRMFRCTIISLAVLWAGAATAAEQPRYAPPPAWVKPAAIPQPPPPTDGSAIQLLLQDSQNRMVGDTSEFYAESAVKILTPQGLASAASIPLSWSPDTDTLIIHRVVILRDGKTIDLLAGGKNVSVLRREGNLELAMLDGRLTATLQPEGLQVGDIIDMALTFERRDPVLQGRSETISLFRHMGLAGRVRIREVWSNAKPIHWRATPGLPAPVVAHGADTTELLIDQSDVVAPKPPTDAPARFSNVGELEVSQFQSWAEVSALMAPLYAKAATLGPNSPLRAEIETIREASTDPKARAEAALRLVQEKVHYVSLAMNFGGYIPADADQTWTRRFGDCKGKSALLIALLHGLGIEAEPALVNTQGGDALGDHLPMLGVFDHVLVRATVGGHVYWLDGTRPADRVLDDIRTPAFGWTLPVRAAGASLEKLQPQPLDEPAFESLKKIDATRGVDQPAKIHAEHIFRGDAAVGWRIMLNGLGHADAERRLREYWRSTVSWAEPSSVDIAYDELRHVLRLTMDGQGTMDWTRKAGVQDFDIGDSSLGFDTSFKREPGPNADAPHVVPFPDYSKWTVVIALPRNGDDFRLLSGGDVDQTLAGRRYQRQSRIQNGVVTMTASERTLVSEIPLADAEAARPHLRDLAAYDVVVRGAVSTLADPNEEEVADHPTDAAGFTRRGATWLNRHDYDRAIADFTEAARLEPRQAKHLYNRGAARLAKGDDAGALDDFDAAIRLNPNDAFPYMARAELMLRRGDARRGWSDFEKAVRLAPNEAAIRARRAKAYDRAGQFQAAVKDIDVLLASETSKTKRADLLNTRCWYRAESGQELLAALDDCDEALALQPDWPATLDSRGLVELRLGHLAKAVADYDSALRLDPKQASALFGRGLAKLRLGKVDEGKADLAAALALSPGIEASFARAGVNRP